jgi:hypothetical protein
MPGLAASEGVRLLIAEDELYMAEAIRDGRTARIGCLDPPGSSDDSGRDGS